MEIRKTVGIYVAGVSRYRMQVLVFFWGGEALLRVFDIDSPQEVRQRVSFNILY